MFTGLIEAVCQVKSVQKEARSMQLAIDLGQLAQDAKIGDSIAVNGVCLTITNLTSGTASFDVSGHTLSISNIATLTPSSSVNIERAMKPTERFGGHFVLGHVDATATIQKIEKKENFWDITFTADPEVTGQLIPKGSIAVNGISLTIAALNQSGFTVAIIPETLKKTTLSTAKIGDKVNIEIDIITKTINKQLEQIVGEKENLTIEKLKNLGF